MRLMPSSLVVVLVFALFLAAPAGCKSQPTAPSGASLAEAERLKVSGQYEQALAAAHTWLTQNPNGAERSDALLLAGQCEMELQRYDDAQRDFQNAQIKPRNSSISAQAKYGMGQAAFARGDYAGAIQVYQLALEVDKSAIPAPKARYKLGLACIRNGNWTDGRDHMRRVIREYPSSAEMHLANEVLALKVDVFVLKCDAFSSGAGANQQVEKLKAQGLKPSIVPITRDGKTLQSVQVGSYTTFAQAQSAADNLSQKGIKALVFP